MQCPLCRNILKDPVQFSSCHHNFCQECANRLVEEKTQECPLCAIPFSSHSTYPNHSLNMTTCPECWEQVMDKDLDSHLQSECPLSWTSCPFCEDHVLSCHLQIHLEHTCPRRLITCMGCEEFIVFEERHRHFQNPDLLLKHVAGLLEAQTTLI